MMAAVVLSPAQVEAIAEAGLGPGAAYVVQQHGASAIAEMTKARGSERGPASRLAAGHARVREVPVIIAHGAPTPGVQHLHAAAARARAAYQPQPAACRAHRPVPEWPGWGGGIPTAARIPPAPTPGGTREATYSSSPRPRLP